MCLINCFVATDKCHRGSAEVSSSLLFTAVVSMGTKHRGGHHLVGIFL